VAHQPTRSKRSPIRYSMSSPTDRVASMDAASTSSPITWGTRRRGRDPRLLGLDDEHPLEQPVVRAHRFGVDRRRADVGRERRECDVGSDVGYDRAGDRGDRGESLDVGAADLVDVGAQARRRFGRVRPRDPFVRSRKPGEPLFSKPEEWL